MTVGDSDNIFIRLKSLIPSGWFHRSLAPVRDAIFGGLADSLAWVYDLLQAVKKLTRIETSTGWFLDLIGWDFFGTAYLRLVNETDDRWRARIIRELFRERTTRKGIKEALVDLTGREPIIFEPWNTGDCGAYDVGTVAYAGQGATLSVASGYDMAASGGMDEGHLHYDQSAVATASFAGAGCYGSTDYPFQIFITAFRPAGDGIPDRPGFDYGGFDGSTELVDDSQIISNVSDALIYQTIQQNAAAGIIPWTAIQS